jgi:hypothetical protein
MFLSKWFRLLTIRPARSQASRPAGRRRRPATASFRPQLESFEDRLVPAAISWINAASGDWDTAANWSTHTIPGAGDDVTIAQSGITVTHTNGNSERIHSLTMASTTTTADTLSISNGSLYIAASSSIQNLTLSGGTLTGPGALSISGPFVWTGSATMSGTGVTSANGGITIKGASTTQNLDTRTLLVNGAGTWTDSASLNMRNGAVFINGSGQTMSVTGGPSINWNGGVAPTFNNSGTLNVNAGTGIMNINTALVNSGTVNVTKGTFNSSTGNLSSNTMTVALGAVLQFGGGNTILNPSSTTSGAGTVIFSSGNMAVQGTYNVTGLTSVVGGSVVFSGALSPFGTLTITNGTTEIDQDVSVSTLNFVDGNLTGPSTITVTSQMTWGSLTASVGPTMSGTGATVLAAGAKGTIAGFNGDSVALVSRTFENVGTLTWTGPGDIHGLNNAVIQNDAGATWTISNNQSVYESANDEPGPVINNNGVIVKSSTGTTTISCPLNNNNTVSLSAGTLTCNVGGDDTGLFSVALSATLNFAGGGFPSAPLFLEQTSRITGKGTVNFTQGPEVDELGTYSVTGKTTLSANNVNFFGPVSMGSLAVTSGYCYFASDFTVPGALNISNATLDGPANIYVGGPSTWSSAVVEGSGSIIVTAGTIITITDNGSGGFTRFHFSERNLINYGTINWGGNDNLVVENGAYIDNAPGGRFVMLSDATIESGANAYFENEGGATVSRSVPVNTSEFTLPLNNDGTVSIGSGTLRLDSGGTSNGTFTVGKGATLLFQGGSYLLGKTSLLNGGGNLTVTNGGRQVDILGSCTLSGGTVQLLSGTTNLIGNGHTIAMGSVLTIDSGTLNAYASFSIPTLNLQDHGTLAGNGKVTVTGTMNWMGAGMTGSGTTIVPSGATLNITGTNGETLDQHTLILGGTASWTGTNDINIGDLAQVLVQSTGIWNIGNDQTFNGSTTATYGVQNAGSIVKSGTSGTTSFKSPVLNTNTITVSSGKLDIAGGKSSGSMTVASGALLKFTSFNYALTSTSSITGAGNVIVDAVDAAGNWQTVNELGTYNIGGSTNVIHGTINFMGPTNVGTSLTISPGNAYFSAKSSCSVANLVLTNNGILGGAGTITVTTQMIWSGATMSGTGITNVAQGATVSMTSTNTTENLDTRTLNLAGAVVWSGTSNDLDLKNGATWNVASTGTVNVGNDRNIFSDGLISTINNSGKWTKTAGVAGSSTTIYPIFNNNQGGSLTLGTGTASTLVLANGGTETGAFTVPAGTTLTLNGTFVFQQSSSVTGAGTVIFNNAADIYGGYAITGDTQVGNSATVSFLANASTGTLENSDKVIVSAGSKLSLSGNYTNQNGGSTYLDGGTISVPSANLFDLESGRLYGSGTISGSVLNKDTVFIGGDQDGSAAALNVTGNYTQASSGQVIFDIGGNTAGTFDTLVISGKASLQGSLVVHQVNGYTLPSKASLVLITYASKDANDFSNKPGGFSTTAGATRYSITAN